MDSLKLQSHYLENTNLTLRNENDFNEKAQILWDAVTQTTDINRTLSDFLTEIVRITKELHAIDDPAASQLSEEIQAIYSAIAAAFEKGKKG